MSQDRNLSLLPFRPPWWLRGGHRQTLAAGCWYGQLPEYSAVQRNITLADGDVVVVHDDCPIGWQPGDAATILMHGLIGSYQSPLLVRLAAKLMRLGIRVFRWDLRGCGAGMGLARMPYHAGCSDDLAHVLNCVVDWCEEPNSDRRRQAVDPFLTLFGVSLSGNILLKYLGEAPERVPQEVLQAIAVNPPIDLAYSLGALKKALTGLYDRHFVGKLFQDLQQRFRHRPDTPMPATRNRPRSVMEFDDWYTAPVSGFGTGREYYDRCSAAQFMSNIRIPTSIITSRDDPVVPLQMFTANQHKWSSRIRLGIADGGGHVGYIAQHRQDPDEFWLDWRIVELMAGRHAVKVG